MREYKSLFAVEAGQSFYRRLWNHLWKRKAPSSPFERSSELEETPSGVQFAID
jgi:hypothetical protein